MRRIALLVSSLLASMQLVGCSSETAEPGTDPGDAALTDATGDFAADDASSGDTLPTETSAGDGAASDAASSDAASMNDAAGDAATSCNGPTLPAWASVAPSRTLEVKAGAAGGGDGTAAKPFATLDAGLKAAKPGDRVLVHAGVYASAYAENLQGTEAQPIVITGAPGEAKPHLQGGSEGLHLTDATYVVVADLEVSGQSANALNVDDGGTPASPSHHLVFRGLDVHDVASGNHDGLKMSGIDDAWIVDSAFRKIGGQMVDMVGCHRVTVARSTFTDSESVGVQMKGGSSDNLVTRNRFVNVTTPTGTRGVNMGGSTGLEFFRPIDAPFEAARIVVSANVFVGWDAPFAYVGCDDCSAVHNTILRPVRWATRILQETTDARFVPCRNGKFENNLIVVGAGISGETVNVGSNTSPSTFTFANNLWFSTANASFVPALPVAETGAVYGDPKLVDATTPDAHLQASSPAIGKGLDRRALVPGDFDGVCWKTPPSIGAYERP